VPSRHILLRYHKALMKTWNLASTLHQTGPRAHGMRNECALRSRTGVRASFMALTFADIVEPRPLTLPVALS
jgi:hypothetical protein